MKGNFFTNNKALLAILVLTLIVFWPVIYADILPFFDDDTQIIQNKNVTNLSFKSVKNLFTSYVLHSYQPLTSLSYSLEYFFFQKNPVIYHFNNLLIHLTNVVLVYLILLKIIKERKIAVLIITTIFAIHPLQSETVSWLSARSALLFSLFFLISCYYYIKYLESTNFTVKLLLLSLFFFLLSLFSKSMAIILPFVIIGLDYIYTRKINIKTVVEKIIFFTFSITFGIISLVSRETLGGLSEKKMQTGRGVIPYNFIEKIQLSCDSILFYIKKFFLPIDLYGVYGYPLKLDDIEIPLLYRIAPLLLLLLFIILGYIYIKSSKEYKKLLLFGFLLFFISIVLTLNIFNHLAQITAERYMYLGLLGVSIPTILFLENIRKKWEIQIIVLYSFIFFFCCYNTRLLVKTWKTYTTRFEFIAEKFEENNLTNNSANLILISLGTPYINKKEYQNIHKAIKYFDRAIKMNKYTPEAYMIRGVAYNNLGNDKEAMRNFNAVINTPKLRIKKNILADVFRFKSEILMSKKQVEQSKINKDSAVLKKQVEQIKINKDSAAYYKKIYASEKLGITKLGIVKLI